MAYFKFLEIMLILCLIYHAIKKLQKGYDLYPPLLRLLWIKKLAIDEKNAEEHWMASSCKQRVTCTCMLCIVAL